MLRQYIILLLGLLLFAAGCGPQQPPAYTVAGRIVDEDGQGVSGVMLMAEGVDRVVETGSDGRWQLDELVGEVTLLPHADGWDFIPDRQTVTDAITDVQFEMVTPAYRVSGTVRDAQGNGVPGVVVTAEATGQQSRTGADGTWRIDGLRTRTKIAASKPGGFFTPAEREVSETVTDVDFNVLNPIIGSAVATREQARQLLEARFVPEEFLELVDLYYDIAPIYGIRPDVALAQAAHETGYFRFGNLVEPWQNNFAGIGATGAASDGFTPLNGADPEQVRFERGVHGAIFDTKAAGVEAQIQHLYAYATAKPLPEGRKLLSPRFTLVPRGSAPYVEYLGREQNPSGTGWATDGEYGFKIINNFIEPMLNMADAS